MRPKPKPSKQVKPPDEAMTMVIHTGKIGDTLKELQKDIRITLSPYTFAKIRENSKNRLKDFTMAAGELEAKMMILLRSNIDKSTFSVCRFPRGPTIHFDIKRYALMSDVRKGVEKSAGVNKTHPGRPFPVFQGFSEDNNEDVAMQSMFQGLFPSIEKETENVKDFKRVVFFTKDSNGIIAIRHYMVSMRDTQTSAAIRDINEGTVKDLGKYNSVEEYVAEVEKNAPKRNVTPIGLKEIGPRIDIQMTHLELNVFGGTKLTSDKDGKKKHKKAEE